MLIDPDEPGGLADALPFGEMARHGEGRFLTHVRVIPRRPCAFGNLPLTGAAPEGADALRRSVHPGGLREGATTLCPVVETLPVLAATC